VPSRLARPARMPCIRIYDAVLPDLAIETIRDPANQLLLHTWNGRKVATVPTVSHLGHTYTSASIATGLAQAVRFPSTCKAFGSTEQLTSSMLRFLTRYAHLLPDAAGLLIAFALASWFADCIPVVPLLYLIGPDNEARLVLRLLGCLCRRSILLGDINVQAMSALPQGLNPTFLIGERSLAWPVRRVLMSSSSRYFHTARGNRQLHTYGAKAFSVDREPVTEAGMRITRSPSPDPLPPLSDADEEDATVDFHAKLLRYRMRNYARVANAQIDTHSFVPAMRDEVRAWLAPICDCPDLLHLVKNSLLLKSRQLEQGRFSDDLCLVIEAALFFCHKANTDHFFVGDLAEKVNHLLKGRHENPTMTDKMAGKLLRDLGIFGERVTAGYRILLTDTRRQLIHGLARDYQVLSVQDGIHRCRHCPSGQLKK
jgi:hypothetical protein